MALQLCNQMSRKIGNAHDAWLHQTIAAVNSCARGIWRRRDERIEFLKQVPLPWFNQSKSGKRRLRRKKPKDLGFDDILRMAMKRAFGACDQREKLKAGVYCRAVLRLIAEGTTDDDIELQLEKQGLQNLAREALRAGKPRLVKSKNGRVIMTEEEYLDFDAPPRVGFDKRDLEDLDEDNIFESDTAASEVGVTRRGGQIARCAKKWEDIVTEEDDANDEYVTFTLKYHKKDVQQQVDTGLRVYGKFRIVKRQGEFVCKGEPRLRTAPMKNKLNENRTATKKRKSTKRRSGKVRVSAQVR